MFVEETFFHSNTEPLSREIYVANTAPKRFFLAVIGSEPERLQRSAESLGSCANRDSFPPRRIQLPHTVAFVFCAVPAADLGQPAKLLKRSLKIFKFAIPRIYGEVVRQDGDSANTPGYDRSYQQVWTLQQVHHASRQGAIGPGARSSGPR